MLSICASCTPDTLSKGDILVASSQPSFLWTVRGERPTSFASASDCLAAGGSTVQVVGVRQDGTPASKVEAQAWLEPAQSATLVPVLESETDASGQALSVRVGTQVATKACLWPGETAGTVTVQVRSGVIETKRDVVIKDRLLPVSATLALSVVPVTATSQLPEGGSQCGVPLRPCVPGQLRTASVSISASPSIGGEEIPEQAVVILSVETGWFGDNGTCNKTGPGQTTLRLSQRAATALWCFGNAGGKATITGWSGTVTATKSLTVPALFAGLFLTPSRTQVSKDGEVTLSASVVDCEGRGISNVPVLFGTDTGTLRMPSTGSLVRTQEDGVAQVTATALMAGTVKPKAEIAIAPSVNCSTSIEVLP